MSSQTACHNSKQGILWPDCFFRSILIWVCTVCLGLFCRQIVFEILEYLPYMDTYSSDKIWEYLQIFCWLWRFWSFLVFFSQEEERNGDVRELHRVKEEKVTPPPHPIHPPIAAEKKEEVWKKINKSLNLILYSIITPFDAFKISCIWKYYGK